MYYVCPITRLTPDQGTFKESRRKMYHLVGYERL